MLTREHFYHLGGVERNRNPMIEAIITNYDTSDYVFNEIEKAEQLTLLENKEM